MKSWTRAQLQEMTAVILERGITLERLAENSGIGQSTIVMIMQGKIRPSMNIRQDLAKGLGIDPTLLE